MNKIILSAIAAITLGSVTASAGSTTFYQDRNGQVFTTAAEGRTAINSQEAREVINSAKAPKKKTEASFFDRIHAKGDLRLRHEIIEKHEGTDNKNRERFRFRYGVNIDVTDNILLETAISSGKYNPTSGNVSFRDDEKIQDYFMETLKIDIADIKYSFDNSWIRVGKAKHHIYRPIGTQLVWDNDIRLEGVNYGFKDNNTMIRLGVNRLHREKGHKGANADNINIFIAQYVHTQKLENAKLNLGAAYYLYDGVKGSSTPYDSGRKGNTLDANGLYAEDFGILEAFAEMKFKDVLGKPFKVAAILAVNTLANNDNIGYDLSAQYGVTKKVGDIKFAATYRDVEKDATFGANNDSDFSGGGTDSTGYYVKTKYKFAKNVDIAGWWNWSKLGDTNREYNRTQLDVILKF
ncbi:MAG: hypothetical protein ACI9TV_002010 [Sulfurimonas sp.]|jgi:hypothetical protein|uniref:putative porin n=1 Tax=Sulfurimonas sp. TaxID=2022749 RepID=UPI0039E70922